MRRSLHTKLTIAVFTAFSFIASHRALAQTPATRPASIAAAYKGVFVIGTAIDFTANNPLTPEELEIIKYQFNQVTPENSMKPQGIHPAEDRYNWEMPDRLVEFAQANNMQIIGHTLAWHAQTAPWFFQGENGAPVTREKALERLKTHITTVVGRYKGKIKGWDVVNEAINDNGPADTENLRETAPWIRAIGPEYITHAFKFAREADPNVELYYNDYNIEKGNKHKSSLLLLKRLIKDGAPITGVGIQGHWGLNNLPYEEIDQAIANYKALGLRVNITELDITISGQGGGQLTPNVGAPATGPAGQAAAAPATNPAARGRGPGGAGGRGGRGGGAPPTPEQLEAQAKAYARLFEIFQKHKEAIDRITFWGLNDARSWRRGQAPLFLDGENKAKPALSAIIAAKK